jgi:hypothetical protein
MKRIFYSILVMMMISMLLFSCDHEKDGNDPLIFSGKLISHSACKSSKSDSIFMIAPDSISCVKFSYDSTSKKLSIQHINAGFNCCPDSLYCHVTINNDTIFIQEFESQFLCDCDCLYDLNIEVEGVEAKPYQLKFIEPYCGDQEQILFGADFSTAAEGSYCVTRTQYPWMK